MNKKPLLRFFEFKKELEQTSIGELTDTVMGYAFKSSEFVEYGVQVIRMGNLYQGTLQLERTPVFMPKLSEESYKRFVISSGDLIMSMTGTMGKRDYGFILKIPKSSQCYLLNQRVMKFVLKGNNSADFLLYLLQNEKLLNRLYSLPGGTKQANLSGQQVKELNTYVPCVLEQQKISNFLSSVDKKISLLKQKHILLDQYKKGVMQKLLSQEIRFKDKNGNDFPHWQEECFSNILVLQLNSLKMKDDKEYELITVRRRNRGVDSRGIFKGKEVLVKNQFELKTNQFVISKRQIVHGACGLVPEKLAGAIVSNEYNVFEPVTEKLDINYFNMIATSLPMRRAFFINSDGVHIEKLLFKTKSWLKTKLGFPCVEEQRKIVSFVESLDKKFELVLLQIEQSQTFKKGLLQQMFV